MTEEALKVALAERVLGWKAAPDRFIKAGRTWLPRWRFSPLTHLEDAFHLLSKAGCTYILTKPADGTFTAQVTLGGRVGCATRKSEAAAITVALARALGIEPEGIN